jgi:U3 small nucleolar RNA-associated protein 25
VHLLTNATDSDIHFLSPHAIQSYIKKTKEAKGHCKLNFMSSIEILLLDSVNIMARQNWQTVLDCLEIINGFPESQGRTNIMHIHDRCLLGVSRHFRQTLMLSDFPTMEMYALLTSYCVNHSGIRKFRLKNSGIKKNLDKLKVKIFKQIYASSIFSMANDRFNYFKTEIWPQINDSTNNGQLIFTRSYFEFARIHHFLKDQDASFTSISEYSSRSDATRSKMYFSAKRKNILLYTERAHFYYQYTINGIKNLIFYSLPEQINFYNEMLGSIKEGNSTNLNTKVLVLFSQLEFLQLEQILGPTQAKKMLTSRINSFSIRYKETNI